MDMKTWKCNSLRFGESTKQRNGSDTEVLIQTDGAKCSVEINGQIINGVTDIRFEHTPLKRPKVYIGISGFHATFDCKNGPRISIPDFIKDTYIPADAVIKAVESGEITSEQSERLFGVRLLPGEPEEMSNPPENAH